MFRHATTSLLLISALALAACSGDDDREDTAAGPAPGEETRVIFNPSSGDLPVPNDLLFANEPAVDGTMHAGVDPANPVITGIDALDGNSLLSPIDIAFSGSLDSSQTLDAASFVVVGESIVPNPNQNVFLLPLSFPGGDPLVQASVDLDGDGDAESVEVPTFAEAVTYQQAVAAGTAGVNTLMALASPTARAEIISLDGGTNNVIRITPLEPLMAETKYLVVITNDVQDTAGYPVQASHAYNFIRDPESPFDAEDETILKLRSLRGAITNWEQLATGYFGFMQSVFDAAGLEETAPAPEDIVFSMTFTTGGTDAVLKSVTAPEIFFEKALRTTYKQEAIAKLVSGTYNVSANNDGLTPTDGAINSTLNVLLTSPTMPPGGTAPNPLYDEAIAGAINAGADYATIAVDPTAAYLMQVAAAEAAISVHNGDAVDIATEAAGTVMALSEGNPAQVFPVPAARATNFFLVDPAVDINLAFQGVPANVFQGEITLPSYQPLPTGGDGSTIATGSWTADTAIGAAIDFAKEQPPGTTPPSDKITYRYPFPAKQADVTVPLLAVLPNAALLGTTKPPEGWPVIIYVHGITTDRSSALPIASAMATACAISPAAPCFATIAIDQPLHGVAPSGSTVPGLFSVNDPDNPPQSNITGKTPSAALTERHFNFTADVQANPIPMDYAAEIGSSGSLFINLSSFTTVRSNLQQMVLDLLNLNASLATMDIDGNGAADDIDESRVYFVGHSLGAVNGVPFIAVNNDDAVQASAFSSLPQIQTAALLNTGGGVVRLLANSPDLAPRIMQGLAGASEELTQGRSGLETYFNVFQGVIDSADVMNFAASLSDSDSSTGILLTEIVGDGTADNPPDQPIPNAADSLWGMEPLEMVLDSGFVIAPFPAPLAGTEPLVAQFGAVPTADATTDGDPAVLVTRFTEGSHGTPVAGGNTEADPLTSEAVFTEMVTEIARFFTFGGDVPASIIANPEVVAE